MGFMNEASPSVTVKKKNLSSLLEYCIENKVDFTVKARTASDEFDIEFIIADTKKAIALGMCLKELKMELNGLTVVPVAAIKAGKKSVNGKDAGLGQGIVAEGDAAMAFEDALQFDLGASN